MTTLLYTLAIVAVVVILMPHSVWNALICKLTGAPIPPPAPPGPQVVVNMPADAKPLDTLTQPGDTVVGPERAVLWFSVFKTTLQDDRDAYTSDAIVAANEAVRKVYGS